MIRDSWYTRRPQPCTGRTSKGQPNELIPGVTLTVYSATVNVSIKPSPCHPLGPASSSTAHQLRTLLRGYTRTWLLGVNTKI